MTDDILKARFLAEVISRSPLVLFSGWHLEDVPAVNRLIELNIRGATLILRNWWSIEDMQLRRADWLEMYIGAVLGHVKAGGHNLLFLCNTPRECEILAGLGARATLGPSNCLVDETIFRPGRHPPFFDAVYNAQMAPFKRHELAVDIDSLLLVYGLFGEAQAGRYREVARLLPHAAMANGDPDAEPGSPAAYRRMELAEVAAHCTMGRTGLCLSAVEGAMHAAIEYLVAGLPVVSTSSLGGREMFFDPDHALIVEAKPEEVARGVRHFARRPPDPLEVRARAMKTVEMYRAITADAIGAALKEAGIASPSLSPRDIVRWLSHGVWYGQEDSTVGAILGGPGYALRPSLLEQTA